MVNTRRRRCVAVKDVASVLSKMMKKSMMPARDSRAFVGSRSAGKAVGQTVKCRLILSYSYPGRMKRPVLLFHGKGRHVFVTGN